MDRLASMETFVRVVETGSFSGAARQLRVGQPAVSKSVAQLEEYLGVKLLTCSTRGLTPTEAGLGYLERARRALEEAAEAELAARRRERPQGTAPDLRGRHLRQDPSHFRCCRNSWRKIRIWSWRSSWTTDRLTSSRRASTWRCGWEK
jgi:DNA-binding transcriptional LysR family regulator